MQHFQCNVFYETPYVNKGYSTVIGSFRKLITNSRITFALYTKQPEKKSIYVAKSPHQ